MMFCRWVCGDSHDVLGAEREDRRLLDGRLHGLEREVAIGADDPVKPQGLQDLLLDELLSIDGPSNHKIKPDAGKLAVAQGQQARHVDIRIGIDQRRVLAGRIDRPTFRRRQRLVILLRLVDGREALHHVIRGEQRRVLAHAQFVLEHREDNVDGVACHVARVLVAHRVAVFEP